VGLTRYNIHRPVRPLNEQEALEAVDQVDRIRGIALAERDQGWAFAADELYLHANLPLPPPSYYGPWDLTENGVGSVAGFLADFEDGISRLPRLEGRRIRILTGASMTSFMEGVARRLAEETGAETLVHTVRNRFFGESVTVAGLLAGADLAATLVEPGPADLVLVSREALNADDLFLDGMSLAELREALEPARVLPGIGIHDALGAL
jgi:NifB/MoaA-like Fe-S oxidoreductase